MTDHESQFLWKLGAGEQEIKELLTYNTNLFNQELLKTTAIPMPDEPFIETWRLYRQEAKDGGVFPILQERLVQLRFPIQEGVSQTEYYRAATRRGVSVENIPEAVGLTLDHPDQLELHLHQTLAGKIPLLVTPHRQDFVTLIQALAYRNEPQRIPNSMGACMVKGFNNWDRIRSYREKWHKANPNCSEQNWQEEFKRLIPQKEGYQDRFIILSYGDYSGIPAEQLNLKNEEWTKKSFIIRREHEVTHYFTQRFFASARNNILDELIADYMGIKAALGYYRAEWFLRFVGLEQYPVYREGGRLENYLGTPPLSQEAFNVLQALVKRAAENLEHFDRKYSAQMDKYKVMIALTRLNLIEFASVEWEKKIAEYL